MAPRRAAALLVFVAAARAAGTAAPESGGAEDGPEAASIPRASDAEACRNDAGLWSEAGCLLARTAALARDAAVHTASSMLPPGGLELLAPASPAVAAALGRAERATRAFAAQVLADSGAGRAAEEATGAAAKAFRSSPVHGPLRDVGASVLEAFDAWRQSFGEAYPQHATLVADRRSALFTAAWLAMLALAVTRGAAWLAACCRRKPPPEIMFFPDKSGKNVAEICKQIGAARSRVFLAMFTLTDDILSAEVLRAHSRGVDVRVISDDEQAEALGSDVQRLADAGVPILLDNSVARMHHKFVVLDGIVLNGSFNWTRMASQQNNENLVIMRDSAVVEAFATEFKRLWGQFRQRGRKPGRAAAAGDAGGKRAPRRRAATPPYRGGC